MNWRAYMALAALAATGCSWGEPPLPVVTGVSPDHVVRGRTVILSVTGLGFEPDVVVDFDRPSASMACNPFRVELRSQTQASVPLEGPIWTSSGEIRVRLDAGLQKGDWDVAVLDGRGRAAILPAGFTVTGCRDDCVDGNRCTVSDRCNGTAFCEGGTVLPDGSACTVDCVAGGEAAGSCQTGQCELPSGGPGACGTVAPACGGP